jgi:hypothetical protein
VCRGILAMLTREEEVLVGATPTVLGLRIVLVSIRFPPLILNVIRLCVQGYAVAGEC